MLLLLLLIPLVILYISLTDGPRASSQHLGKCAYSDDGAASSCRL